MGDYNIQQVMQFTYQYFPTRFNTYRRDIVKRIQIKEIREIERHDVEPRERIKYQIISKSYPNYPPYLKKGKRYQRSIAHYYDVVLEMDELTLTTTNWRMRVGSGRKWVDKLPQSQIKKLYRETKNKLRKKAGRKGKTKKEANQLYKKYVEKHKKRAPYLDEGDYNSRVLGINGDWIFRDSYAFWHHGHLWGRNYYGNIPSTITNPNYIPFFPKHAINVINTLMNSGVIQ
jgi:hypothetical protein